jgi:hypothetical protein
MCVNVYALIHLTNSLDFSSFISIISSSIATAFVPSRIMSPLRDQLWTTAKAAFEEFGHLTPESVIAYRCPTCIHRLFPATAAVPDRSNQEYSNFVMSMKTSVSNLRLVVQGDFEPLIDETTRQVLAHIKSVGDSKYGPVETEYFMVVKMNEDGTQIIEFVEFVDSAYTLEFIKKASLKV